MAENALHAKFCSQSCCRISVLLNLVDSVHLKDREIKEDESAEHLQLMNTSTLPSSDMAESTSEGFLDLGGFFASNFSPKEKVSLSKRKEKKEKRMLVIQAQREGSCGRCRSKARRNLNVSLISRNLFPSPCYRLAWDQMLFVFLRKLLHLRYMQADSGERCRVHCAGLRGFWSVL